MTEEVKQDEVVLLNDLIPWIFHDVHTNAPFGTMSFHRFDMAMRNTLRRASTRDEIERIRRYLEECGITMDDLLFYISRVSKKN